jgi:AcrR family transcriptional regulator
MSLAVAPLPDPTEPRAGEFLKSGRTRRRILDIAVRCLAEHGYRSLSAAQVAEAAGLSRATMIYHFPTRRALVEALIAYVTRERIARYEAAMAAIPRSARFRETAVDLAWAQAREPAFAAFAELAQAARTDPELAQLFRPAMAAFDRGRREAAIRIFPADTSARPDFDLGRDVLRFLLEGLVQQDGITYDREARLRALRRFTQLLVASPEGQALLARTMAECGR